MPLIACAVLVVAVLVVGGFAVSGLPLGLAAELLGGAAAVLLALWVTARYLGAVRERVGRLETGT